MGNMHTYVEYRKSHSNKKKNSLITSNMHYKVEKIWISEKNFKLLNIILKLILLIPFKFLNKYKYKCYIKLWGIGEIGTRLQSQELHCRQKLQRGKYVGKTDVQTPQLSNSKTDYLTGVMIFCYS